MVSAPSLRLSPCVTSSLVASQSGGMSSNMSQFVSLKNCFGLVGGLIVSSRLFILCNIL